MSLGDRSWSDRAENYVDGYTINIKGTTATAAVAVIDQTHPAVVYSLSVSVNPAVGSGEVSLRNGPGTATAGDTIYAVNVASAASSIYEHIMAFPRGVVFASGIVISATTISGSVNLTYKQRYE